MHAFRFPAIIKIGKPFIFCEWAYPSLKMSASLRKAELMRMGKGYFWKSLGKSTTASHCSPSFPDLNPASEDMSPVTAKQGRIIQSVTFSTNRHMEKTQHSRVRLQSMSHYANVLANRLTHLCPAPWARSLRPVLVLHNKPRTGRSAQWRATLLFSFFPLENKHSPDSTEELLAFHCTSGGQDELKPDVDATSGLQIWFSR